MGIYISVVVDHSLKLLICVITLLNTKVNGQDSAKVNLTLLANAVDKGAVCLDGSSAGYHYAKGFGEGADSWMIYLPGGGWCGSKKSCADRVQNNPGLSSTNNITDTYFGGILSPDQNYNPDFYNWNRVFIRYCDGSSFIGDVEEVDPETKLYLRGSRIFTAVIDELLSIGLENAKNAILTGNSAGGLATILNCDRFRALVPNANTLKCISDSGFFIHAKDLPNVEGRELTFSSTVEFHGIAQFLPESCTSRMNPGLCFFPENLVGDIQTPLFLLNSDFDKFQIQVNLKPYPADISGWANCTNNTSTCTPAQLQIIKDFRDTFLETVKGLGDNKSRGLFINSCYIHDYLYSSRRFNSADSPRLDNKRMRIYIPAVVDHSLKLLACVIIVLNTKANSQGSAKVGLTLVGNAVQKGAVCLDGSPAGYHYAQGFGDGANSWMVYLPGGGWCGSKASCLDRVKKNPMLSSTKNITDTYFEGILSSNKNQNSDFYNWNRVFIRYCDGSSFMGDVEAVDPTTNLHLRGSRIFTAVVDELLSKGLKNAKNAILVGNSAGGLATILNCDRFRSLVPNVNTLKCVSDSGFFIHAKDLPNVEGREQTFSSTVQFHGIAQFLPKSCTSRMNPGLCFFPENLVGDVKTPLFLLNSEFDKFQISVNLKPHPADNNGWANCTTNIKTCTSAQLQIIKDFRNTFLETVKGLPNNPSRGLFINSCYIHDYLYSSRRYNWAASPKLEIKSIAKAIGDWYYDRSSVYFVDSTTDYPVDCKI